MAAMGVDRVNLGVQTFTPHVQARIGRIQPLDMVERAVGQLRAAGIATGFDLMYGLPGQTQDDLAATLEATIALHPARIALFGYAHMPRLPPPQRRHRDRTRVVEGKRGAVRVGIGGRLSLYKK